MARKLFAPGHSGRPKGARDTRTRLTAQVFEDILVHWNEPIEEGSERRKGPAALEACFTESPGEYLRLTAGVLPKEFTFEAVTAELDDEQIDELIMVLRQRLIEARASTALLASADVDGVRDEPSEPRH
jgi:hypothetical protein